MKLPDILAEMLMMLLLAAFFIFMGIRGLRRGAARYKLRVYHRETDPAGFWLLITTLFTAGVIMLAIMVILGMTIH